MTILWSDSPKEQQMSEPPKYPDITVPLVGKDGNAMMIIARVNRALGDAGVTAEEIDAFAKEAVSGDYDHVLRTVMKWVKTE